MALAPLSRLQGQIHRRIEEADESQSRLRDDALKLAEQVQCLSARATELAAGKEELSVVLERQRRQHEAAMKRQCEESATALATAETALRQSEARGKARVDTALSAIIVKPQDSRLLRPAGAAGGARPLSRSQPPPRAASQRLQQRGAPHGATRNTGTAHRRSATHGSITGREAAGGVAAVAAPVITDASVLSDPHERHRAIQARRRNRDLSD